MIRVTDFRFAPPPSVSSSEKANLVPRAILKNILFFEKDGSFSVYLRDIQSLAIEIYKFLHVLSQAFMGDIIKRNRPPTNNLRKCLELYSRNSKTVRYGTETISFLAPKIWAIVPQKLHLPFII